MWLSQPVIPSCLVLYPPRMQEKVSVFHLSACSLLPMFCAVLFLRKKHVVGMRACLPCHDCCTPGQVKENFSKSNCTHPNRKTGSCKKGAKEILSRQLWQSPCLTAVCGSDRSRGSTSWEPHISVQLHSGLEATGSCWHDPHQTNHLKRSNGWGQGGGMRLTFKSFIWSVSHQRLLLSPFTSLPCQYERAKDFACSLYRKGVELVPQFWPMMFLINRNFILLNFCLIETTRTRKELAW